MSDKFHIDDYAAYKEEKEFSLPYTPDFVFIETYEEAFLALDIFVQHKLLAVDVETTGLDPYKDELLLIQVAIPDKCFILNCRKVDPSIWGPIFSDPSIVKILQNASFDYKFIKTKLGVSLRPVFDTMVAERLINAGRQKRASFDFMARKYFDMDVSKGIRKGFENFSGENFSRAQKLYAANDALLLFRFYDRQVELIYENDLLDVALLEFDTVPVVAEMELAGCYIDVPKWKSLIDKAREKKKEVETKIRKILEPVCSQLTIFGEPVINLDSPKQLLEILGKLGLELESTGEEVLKKIDHPVAKLLLDWRNWNTVIKKYGDKFLKFVDKDTSRLYSSFHQVVTDTGRFAASKPNVQQIPRFIPDDSNSLNFRSCFMAPKGKKLLTYDYSQEEMRILAEISKDYNLLEAFSRDLDLHTKTASDVFDVPMSKVGKNERNIAKTLNFAIGYGAGAFRISNELNVSEDEAQRHIDNYFKAYPGIKDYLISTSRFALENEYTRSASGRIRYYKIPTQDDPDYKKKLSAAKREAANMRIQSAGADVLKKAMCLFFYGAEKRNYNAKIIMVVHDEIVVEVIGEQAEEVSEFLKECMISAFKFYFKEVPIKVDGCISNSWEH